MSLTLTDDEAPNLSQDVGQNIANYFLRGIDPDPIDPIQGTEAQDTASHSYGTAIIRARAPYTYENASAILGPIRQFQELQPGFVAGLALQSAFSNRALTSLSLYPSTMDIGGYRTSADFLTFAFTFAETVASGDLTTDPLPAKVELQDLLDIGHHVRLPPKRRREMYVDLKKRRKGQPLAIEPEDL